MSRDLRLEKLEDTLNLVIPFNYYSNRFHKESLDTKWKIYYPSLYEDESIWEGINTKTVPAVGYLYVNTQTTYNFITTPRATATLLTPTIGVVSFKQMSDIFSMPNPYSVYFVQAKKPVDAGSFVYFQSSGGRELLRYARVSRFFNKDVERSRIFMDPVANLVNINFKHANFLMFELDSAYDKFLIPYFPKVEAPLQVPVGVVGVPGPFDFSKVHDDKIPRLSETKRKPIAYTEVLDNYVESTYVRHRLCFSVGHMKLMAINRIQAATTSQAHNCYTHDGNLGSPIVPLHDPSRLLAIHVGDSIYPGVRAALPVCDVTFIECYVRYVVPKFLEKPELLSDSEKQNLAIYLKTMLPKIKEKDDVITFLNLYSTGDAKTTPAPSLHPQNLFIPEPPKLTLDEQKTLLDSVELERDYGTYR